MALTLRRGLLAPLDLGQALPFGVLLLLFGLALVLHVLRQGLRGLETELPEQVSDTGAVALVLLTGEAAGQFVLGDRDHRDAGVLGRRIAG
ncbi:hypothetical protein [Streptomyces sp. NPDC003395]